MSAHHNLPTKWGMHLVEIFNWMEPESDKRGESFTMYNVSTTKMFRNIDKQGEIIGPIALVSISFWSQLVIKQRYKEKKNLGGGEEDHQQVMVHTFSPGCHTTDWHATPIITDWSFTVLFSLSLWRTVSIHSWFCSVFLHVTRCLFTIDSVQYIRCGTPLNLKLFWPKFFFKNMYST